jgi:hypothetical protein
MVGHGVVSGIVQKKPGASSSVTEFDPRTTILHSEPVGAANPTITLDRGLSDHFNENTL